MDSLKRFKLRYEPVSEKLLTRLKRRLKRNEKTSSGNITKPGRGHRIYRSTAQVSKPADRVVG